MAGRVPFKAYRAQMAQERITMAWQIHSVAAIPVARNGADLHGTRCIRIPGNKLLSQMSITLHSIAQNRT